MIATTDYELASLINRAALETAARWLTAEQGAEDDASNCLASACFAVGAESFLIHMAKLSGADMPAPALRILAITREGLTALHTSPLPPPQHRRALAALHKELMAVLKDARECEQ